MKAFFYRIFLYLLIIFLIVLNLNQWTKIQNFKSDLYGKEIYHNYFQSVTEKYKLLLKTNKEIKQKMQAKQERPKIIIKFKTKYKYKEKLNIKNKILNLPDLEFQLVKTNKNRWYLYSSDQNVIIDEFNVLTKPEIALWFGASINLNPGGFAFLQYEKWLFGGEYQIATKWSIKFAYRLFQF